MEKPSNALTENKMATMPLGKLLINMAVPMVLAMLVQALYNVVDSLYVSRISESAVTALSLAFPVQNIQIGFATGIGVGVNSVLSKSLGENNRENANRAAGNGMVLVGIVTVVFILFGAFATRPFFEVQSNIQETVDGGVDYNTAPVCKAAGIEVLVAGSAYFKGTDEERAAFVKFIQE